MQRWIFILAIVLAVQLAAAIALGLRGDRLVPALPDTLLVAADLKGVDKLAIDGPVSAEKSDDTNRAGVELVKRDGGWLIPAYYDAPADAEKVQALLQRLSSLKRGLAVATSAAGPRRFKVAEDDYERRLVASVGDKPLGTLYLGRSSGPRTSNARTSQDSAVYAVELSPVEVPTEEANWLDHALLKIEADTLAEVGVVADGKALLTLQRSTAPEKQASAPPGWQAQGLLAADKRLDQRQAITLIDAVASLKVDAVLGIQSQPEWQQDRPQLRLTLKDTHGMTVTWTLSKPTMGETYVLKTTDRPWYFELKSWNARPLIDAAASDKLFH